MQKKPQLILFKVEQAKIGRVRILEFHKIYVPLHNQIG